MHRSVFKKGSGGRRGGHAVVTVEAVITENQQWCSSDVVSCSVHELECRAVILSRSDSVKVEEEKGGEKTKLATING